MANITSIPEVEFVSENTFKFIVAEVSDSTGMTKLILRADQDLPRHNNILERLRAQAEIGLSFYCLGGGFIRFNKEEKTIQVFGESLDFKREPDRNRTVRMLQATYPDFQVTGGNQVR